MGASQVEFTGPVPPVSSCVSPGCAISKPFRRQATAAEPDICKLAVAEASQFCKSGVDVRRMCGPWAAFPVVPQDMSNAPNHPYRPHGQS